MNYQTLSPDEKVRLVEAIKEDLNGRKVTFDDFRERVGLSCDDIPGLEYLGDEDLATLVAECWSIYRR